MPKAEITYKAVDVNEKATHGDYKHLCQMWEGLTVGTAKIWATEMRDHPDFKQFIDNPTHKLVFINYEGFRLFVKWKSRNRYRTKKETLAEMLENLKKRKTIGSFNMSLLNKIKLYFSGIIEEVNLDWKKVALEINQQLIELQMKYQDAIQRISDLEKKVAIYEEKEKTQC